jgi:hypothetical protein
MAENQINNGRLDEEDDPSQPSRFISEALRAASSIEKTVIAAKECHTQLPGIHQVNHLD